jgi:hypothetical protein
MYGITSWAGKRSKSIRDRWKLMAFADMPDRGCHVEER